MYIKLVSGFIVLALLLSICFCSKYDLGIRAAQKHSKDDADVEKQHEEDDHREDVEVPNPTPAVVKCWEAHLQEDELTVDTSVEDSSSNHEELRRSSSTLWQSIRSSLQRRRSTVKIHNIKRQSIAEEPQRRSSIDPDDLRGIDII